MSATLQTAPGRLNALRWLLVYGLLWVLLTGASGWLFGLPWVLAAALLSVHLQSQPWRLRARQLLPFIGFFGRELIAGGWDVARRALHPRLPLNPAWVEYPLHDPCPRVRLLLSACVGLLPGTFASHFSEDTLHLHVLDQDLDWRTTVAQLEQRLGRLLGDSG